MARARTTVAWVLLVLGCGEAWVGAPSARPRRRREAIRRARGGVDVGGVDVSDLGLTMDDVEAPLPDAFHAGLASSGCESTSRVAPDEGARWRESRDEVCVTLTIPGLRGQPSGCLAVEATATTATVTAFGYAVWSCVLRGAAVPGSARVEIRDGDDAVPVVEIAVAKQSPGAAWGGFIASVGEDSLL